ncbi:Aldo/keto reductase [Arboricoccus pini]|uniref:Aldo/keto reductase n=1 Tax=Arboricoccus pini TaxID=1963835 RepID=A0A212QQJ4_9PROT|nr:aldo/keto reductase [Arboricoccus pini]SNB61701.1 Aldo/keto reductase [Arboricoccus pini]
MTLPMIEIAGRRTPRLGQGTWNMGERGADREAEARALRRGLDLGLTLVDTAEMYAQGGSEEVVGAAIAGRRDEVVLVSKVLPSNASRQGTVAACERSLKRLATDHLDLYLLHWTGSHPLEETLAGFAALQAAGKIRHWGVSNFDADDMAELLALEGGAACATNQVLYNLTRRWPEARLAPLCRRRSIPLMAYSPIEQGRMLRDAGLKKIAAGLGATVAQVALAWLLRQPGVIPIPKAARPVHVEENRRALELELPDETLSALNRLFPAPKGNPSIEML